MPRLIRFLFGLSVVAFAAGWFLEAKASSSDLQADPSPSPGAPTAILEPDSATPSPTTAQIANISFPTAGAAIQGNITILGSSSIPGFTAAELDFAYSKDTTQTWFRIATLTEPIQDGRLANWDTTTITDGIYNLRLVVYLEDGTQTLVHVAGIRVRNYSAVETNTPTPVTPTATRVPGDTPVPTTTATPTSTPLPPTPTAYPRNPAEISRQDVISSFFKGSLGLIGLFALMAVYQQVKKLRSQAKR